MSWGGTSARKIVQREYSEPLIGSCCLILVSKRGNAYRIPVKSGASTEGQAKAIICCLECYPESRVCLQGILLRVEREFSSYSACFHRRETHKDVFSPAWRSLVQRFHDALRHRDALIPVSSGPLWLQHKLLLSVVLEVLGMWTAIPKAIDVTHDISEL